MIFKNHNDIFVKKAMICYMYMLEFNSQYDMLYIYVYVRKNSIHNMICYIISMYMLEFNSKYDFLYVRIHY